MLRVSLVLVAGIALASLMVLNWDEVRYCDSLEEIARRDLRQAQTLAPSSPDSALTALRRTPPSLQSDAHRLLQLRLLSTIEGDSAIIALVESAGRAFQERAFADYLGPYMQACRRRGEIDRFQRLVSSLRYVPGERSRRTMLRGVLSLLDEGRYEEARQMLNMFSPGMFPDWTWEILSGAAAFYTGHTVEARERIDRALGLHGSGGHSDAAAQPDTRMPPGYRAVLYDLKLLASPRDSLTDTDLMILSGAQLQVTRRNLVALALHYDLLDLAAAKLDELAPTDSTRVLEALLQWKRGNYAQSDALMSLAADETKTRMRQAMLLQGELDYHMRRYQQAECNFKYYLRLQSAPPLSCEQENYANYAIGWAFHEYFRYSNAAYWWIKNLGEDSAGLFDSLATGDLATLYTFTEHHEEARRYYRRLALKYPSALQGDMLSSYLDNMNRAGQFVTLRREFMRLYEEVRPAQRSRFARVLGDVFFDSGDWATARDFYRLLPPEELDDTIVWRRERCALLLGEEADAATFLRRFVETWPLNRYSARAALDLMRYYVETGESQLALELAMPPAAPVDTTSFLRGRALAMLGRQAAACDTFELLVLGVGDRSLRLKALVQLDTLLANEGLTAVSRRYAALADSVNDRVIHEAILVRLAAHFEKNELYREANELYFGLMEDSTYVDTGTVRLRLADNLLRMQQFEAVQNILRPVDANLTHPHRAEALYMCYLAAIALDRPDDARRKLLDIYLAYPDNPHRGEVAIGLADLYDEAGQSLPAWYFYDQALPLVGLGRAQQVRNRLKELRADLGDDIMGLRQPLGFRAILLQTERALSP
ncbi:MAG: hypothetical protein K8R90_09230 [Candidatus Cloacimonetes bacterium]|nr:hypothetical protein [Candidatus Cloacimonadota bacterium]